MINIREYSGGLAQLCDWPLGLTFVPYDVIKKLRKTTATSLFSTKGQLVFINVRH